MENACMKSRYDRVTKYTVRAKCAEPFHVGSADGDLGAVLVHPVLGQPFLQATGIAGAFRDYFSDDAMLQRELFGIQDEDDTIESKVQFTDGFFEKTGVYTELRPRVRIDRKTGSCQKNSINGGTIDSGQKFETEVVASGSQFHFFIYVYEKEKSCYTNRVEQALAALHKGYIQFGGQKSNGCGYVELTSVFKAVYDMKHPEDRSEWERECKDGSDILTDLQGILGMQDTRTHFVLKGKTKGSILVKSVFVSDYSEDAPDAENIRNHKKEYIIPASSVKGVVRNQLEKICSYKGLDAGIIDMMFGKKGKKGEGNMLGCVRFFDCVIGDVASNDQVPVQNRIHIDKFTGGVMYQGWFSEKPAGGEVAIKVDLIKTADDRMKGLLLLVLRDIATGIVPLGSESSVGRGFLEGESLSICEPDQSHAEVYFKKDQIEDDYGVISKYLSALDQEEECQEK